MKRQYRYYETVGFQYIIEIFNDGKRVSVKKVWGDELNEETSLLEALGYTYGYTREEVDDARLRYKHKLYNQIPTEIKVSEESE